MLRRGKPAQRGEIGASTQRYGDLDSDLVVGPWLGEVGPELQYWIPFLQRLQRDNRLQCRKLIAMSRGGTETWYANIADEYIELFDHLDPQEQADKMARRGGFKQKSQTQLDTELVTAVARSSGLTNYHTLHPSTMWAEVTPWVWEKIDMDMAADKLDFRLYPATSEKYAQMVDQMNLPSEFYAVKFYVNDAFPANQINLELVEDVVSRITSHHYVVDLGMPLRVDDHISIDLNAANRLISVGAEFEAHTNLGVQTEIIRRSKGLVGTNGGITVLPAFVGVPSLSFYSVPRSNFGPNIFQHESMTVRLYESLSNQSYTVMSADDWARMRHMFWK